MIVNTVRPWSRELVDDVAGFPGSFPAAHRPAPAIDRRRIGVRSAFGDVETVAEEQIRARRRNQGPYRRSHMAFKYSVSGQLAEIGWHTAAPDRAKICIWRGTGLGWNSDG